MDEREYDVVVVGAGPAGEVLAGRVAAAGLTAVVVEAELVGGDCSYWACIPSKALLRPLQALAAARNLAGAREAVTAPVDVPAVLARRDSFTSAWSDDGQVRWLDGASIDLVRGHGRLRGERRVEVTAPDQPPVVLVARQAVCLAVGTDPVLPQVDGLADVHPWQPRDATSAKAVPRRLAVIGGGVVACEQAVTWKGLGAEEVTLLVRGDSLLARLPAEVGSRLRRAFRAQGIDVRLQVEAVSVARPRSGGPVDLLLSDGTELSADELLVATGRRPRTRDLGLETVGLEPGGWVATDDTLLARGADGRWLYAVGDVSSRAQLTHMGKYQARVCADVVVARSRGERVGADRYATTSATADSTAVPQVVFTDPEVAQVGLTEREARERGLPVRTVEVEIGDVAGAALLRDGYSGWAQLVVDSERQVVLGATFLGPAVGELLHAATVAIVGEVPLDRLWHAVPAFPTVSELWLRLLEAYGL